MQLRIFLRLVTLGGSVFFCAVGSAEPLPVTTGYVAQPVRPAPQQVRDPFTPSALMYETVGKQSGMANSAYGFSPSSEGIKIPK